MCCLVAAKPESAGCQEPQEDSLTFLQPEEPILEKHCGCHSSAESLLLHLLHGEWNGSQEDPTEYERAEVDLVRQAFVSLAWHHHVSLEP